MSKDGGTWKSLKVASLLIAGIKIFRTVPIGKIAIPTQ
jgi:hypothetical protein